MTENPNKAIDNSSANSLSSTVSR